MNERELQEIREAALLILSAIDSYNKYGGLTKHEVWGIIDEGRAIIEEVLRVTKLNDEGEQDATDS